MTVYLVTYDLNKETSRPNITKELDKTGWAKLSESSYAISTNETAEQVYARFDKYTDENDNFYVIKLSKPFHGQGPKDVNEWLAKELS